MKTTELVNYLYKLLNIADYSDVSLNGLQVASGEREIKRVVFAVDACKESIDKTAELEADMLFVHHGLFWGEPIAITGTHCTRVKTLLDNNIALFTCHLPLDASYEFGNNAEMGRIIGLKEPKPFSEFRGKTIGWYGKLETPLEIEEICKKLGFSEERGLKVLDFGKKLISSVGIVSGKSVSDVFEINELGMDAFITGECSHEVFHYCKEAGINMICGGHYQSEVFGVQAVARHLKSKLGIETCFVDIPTSL